MTWGRLGVGTKGGSMTGSINFKAAHVGVKSLDLNYANAMAYDQA